MRTSKYNIKLKFKYLKLLLKENYYGVLSCLFKNNMDKTIDIFFKWRQVKFEQKVNIKEQLKK